ncbi:MAG TPA: holo-ACP synthase [Burkholderiales bacterium]|nr:holo-ACP synthase [Burkholderiales bacterium]
MIYGVGTDLVEIARVARVLERFGDRFAERILCDAELARFHALGRPAAYLAKRFAAKEAFGKALGSGVRAPADWHGVWVSNHRLGQPRLEFSSALAALLSAQGIRRTHLSLSDERKLASATVILECDA